MVLQAVLFYSQIEAFLSGSELIEAFLQAG